MNFKIHNEDFLAIINQKLAQLDKRMPDFSHPDRLHDDENTVDRLLEWKERLMR